MTHKGTVFVLFTGSQFVVDHEEILFLLIHRSYHIIHIEQHKTYGWEDRESSLPHMKKWEEKDIIQPSDRLRKLGMSC